MMKQLSQHLTALITVADDLVRRRQLVPSALPQAFAELAGEIRRAHERPAEGIRTTHAAIIMVTAIEAFCADSNDHWQMLIGATLPLVRRDAFQALKNEREIARGEGGFSR
jgi:hypothetical protein